MFPEVNFLTIICKLYLSRINMINLKNKLFYKKLLSLKYIDDIMKINNSIVYIPKLNVNYN